MLASRRLLVPILLIATLAACGSPPKNRSQSQGVGAGQSPSATASAAVGDPNQAPPRPGASSTSTSPPAVPASPSSSSAAPPPPPPGNGYADRLPKFGKPPKANRINLPEGGGAPYYARIPTDQPVAFLTIDDGWIKRPEALELFRESGIQVTLFLTINAIKDNPAYFKQLRDAGAVIEAHTLTHPELKGKPYAFQKKEICGSADQLATLYGKRPTLFRPPFGDKDATTLKVAHECGLKAGFFWKETVDKGTVRFQEGHTVQPGDIILMHFRDRFVDDFIAALQAIAAAGLTPALLENYIPA